MSDDTRRLSVGPILEQIARIEGNFKDQGRSMQIALGELSSIKRDIEWMRENAGKAESTIGEVRDRVASLEGRMVDGIRDRVVALETHLTRAAELLERLDKINERLTKIENRQNHQGVLENRKAISSMRAEVKALSDLADNLGDKLSEMDSVQEALEKEETKRIEWWKWLVGAIIAFISALPGVLAYFGK